MWIIAGIWTFSLLVTLPYGLYMSFRNTYCEEDWPSESFRQVRTLLKPYKGFIHNTKDVLRIAKDFEHT